MANKRKASEMARDENEYGEVLQYLPRRFREINTNSVAMESFNLMNDDLIQHRILPRLHMRHLHHLIVQAKPGPVRNRLRDLITNIAPQFQSKFSYPSLLFHGALTSREIKLYDCAIRDKRLPRLPNQLQERHVRLPDVVALPNHEYTWVQQPFMEAVGQKVVYWALYHPRISFVHILNVDHNRAWNFRPLHTSAIFGEIDEREYERSGSRVNDANLIVTAVVGHRLVVLLQLKHVGGPLETGPTHMLALDANTEKLTVLPECPGAITKSCIPISWKRKLYLVDFQFLHERRPLGDIVPLHFDFETNMWKSVANTVAERDDVNINFAKRLMELPVPGSYLDYFGKFERRLCIKSSRSGTLYAVYRDGLDDNTSLEVYAMDDLMSGWSIIDLVKSEYAQNHGDLFVAPPISRGWFNLWEVNERDMLFLAVHYQRSLTSFRMERSTWWVFNKEDGVKTFNSESWPVNTDDISALRLGW